MAAQQQRARSWIQNIVMIVVSIAIVGLVFFYFSNRLNAPLVPSAPSEFLLVEPVPVPIAIDPADVLFTDTFDRATDSWELSVAGEARYDRSALILNDKTYEGPAVARPHLSFDNFVLAVHTRWLSGAVGGRYGVRFRVDEESGDFYGFYITTAGNYVIDKQLDGNRFEVKTGFSSAIVRGGGVNLLRVEAYGDRMRFFINEAYVGDVVNNAIGAGDIMLVAERVGQTDSFMVAFDNLVVAQYADGVVELR